MPRSDNTGGGRKQLREIIEQADRNGDASASEAASKELEVLSRELSAAAGLHGRDRRLDDEVERARKTVSARIHDALSRLAFAHPALGSHFSSAIVLGVRCSYQPSEPIQWEVGSVWERKVEERFARGAPPEREHLQLPTAVG